MLISRDWFVSACIARHALQTTVSITRNLPGNMKYGMGMIAGEGGSRDK